MKDFPAAYQVSEGSALSVDRPFYERIAAETGGRTLVDAFTLPIRFGRVTGDGQGLITSDPRRVAGTHE